MSSSPVFSRLVGTGSALPARCVSNVALESILAQRGVITSDAWIRERTGIEQRYFASESETTTELALGAARQALASAGWSAQDPDLIIVATSTPDQVFPSTACMLQGRLGNVGAACFDVQAVCSGFVYALTVADAMIRSGQARKALVVGAEVFSRIMDWDDRTTCVLFGDGAGAVTLCASDVPGLLACRLHADGSHAGILCTAGRLQSGQVMGDPFLRMDGQAVFKQAVSVLGQNAQEVLQAADLGIDQLDWLIPHQANIRILQSVARKLGLPMEKVIACVSRHGNTSAASVPLALDEAVKGGQVRPGQHILLQGVGGGFTWGSVLLKML
jgi:3-oxoacyl-[acyl-carrier-protein] synthase-3